jgi:hypothetical protein
LVIGKQARITDALPTRRIALIAYVRDSFDRVCTRRDVTVRRD